MDTPADLFTLGRVVLRGSGVPVPFGKDGDYSRKVECISTHTCLPTDNLIYISIASMVHSTARTTGKKLEKSFRGMLIVIDVELNVHICVL